MRIQTAAAAALATLTLAVAPAPSRAAGAGHLEHLLHGGLGRPLTRAEVARLPKSFAVARAEGRAAHARHRTHKAYNARQAAERVGYKPVNELTNGAFPKFYPSLGAVYVRPKTIPVGPFLAFDRQDRQVATIYMLSLEEMNGHRKFEASGTRQPHVDHVQVYYHGGHPGVDFPHYHQVLWHVSKKGEERVAK